MGLEIVMPTVEWEELVLNKSCIKVMIQQKS
jgi:hypothetical protein